MIGLILLWINYNLIKSNTIPSLSSDRGVHEVTARRDCSLGHPLFLRIENFVSRKNVDPVTYYSIFTIVSLEAHLHFFILSVYGEMLPQGNFREFSSFFPSKLSLKSQCVSISMSDEESKVKIGNHGEPGTNDLIAPNCRIFVYSKLDAVPTACRGKGKEGNKQEIPEHDAESLKYR